MLGQYTRHVRFFFYLCVTVIIDGISLDLIECSEYRSLASDILHSKRKIRQSFTCVFRIFCKLLNSGFTMKVRNLYSLEILYE